MPEPNRPILDYKTPERRKRITAWTVISWVYGVNGLLVAIWLTYGAVDAWMSEKSAPSDGIEIALFLLILALFAWVLSIIWLKHVIVSNRKSSNPSIESDE